MARGSSRNSKDRKPVGYPVAFASRSSFAAYRAIRAFAAELTAPDLAYRHRLEPGECHIFDNHRVLHARTAFDPSSGPRHMQSCVIERDEFHNRLRLLALACGRADEANLALTSGALG